MSSNQAQESVDDSTESHVLQSVSTTQILAELRELRAEIHRMNEVNAPINLWKDWVPV